MTKLLLTYYNFGDDNNDNIKNIYTLLNNFITLDLCSIIIDYNKIQKKIIINEISHDFFSFLIDEYTFYISINCGGYITYLCVNSDNKNIKCFSIKNSKYIIERIFLDCINQLLILNKKNILGSAVSITSIYKARINCKHSLIDPNSTIICEYKYGSSKCAYANIFTQVDDLILALEFLRKALKLKKYEFKKN
jgi:hypothetical protein